TGLRQALGVALLAAGVAHAPAQALDLNDATAQQLAGIRGIGPRTAQTIVSERERAGRFESLEDLAERVRGISQKKAEALGAAGLTVGASGAASTAAGAPAKAESA
ncbi:ComEA family DNA-binding protein, partial [Achromobacter xylosoxidans]